MSEKEQIEKLKDVALKHTSDDRLDIAGRESAVDAMAAYGDIAIPALIEVSQKADISLVRKRALESIARIKREAKEKAEQKRSLGS